MGTLTRTFRIDPEFRDRIPAPNDEAFSGLEADILADGCILDPLKIWAEEGILLDGHHRYTIAQKHGIRFEVHYVSLPDRESALDWIDRHAINQRNLPPKAESLIRGRIYNRAKKSHGGDRTGASDQNEHLKNTSETLASELGVSPATLRRDGEFAQAVDKLGIGQEVTKGEVTAPRSKVIDAAKALPEKPTERQKEKAKKELEAPGEPKPKPAADDRDARIAELTRLLSEANAKVDDLTLKNAELNRHLEEAGAQIQEINEENESFRRILDGDDLLASYKTEVQRVAARARVAESQLNGRMVENHDLAKRLKSALKKLGKAPAPDAPPEEEDYNATFGEAS